MVLRRKRELSDGMKGKRSEFEGQKIGPLGGLWFAGAPPPPQRRKLLSTLRPTLPPTLSTAEPLPMRTGTPTDTVPVPPP